jgi:hypothetical protein
MLWRHTQYTPTPGIFLPPACRENRELLELLEEAVNPDTVGRGVYFSHRYDLTTTSQRADYLKATDPAYATQVGKGLEEDSRTEEKKLYHHPHLVSACQSGDALICALLL